MGFESRDYYRNGSYTQSFGWQFDMTPVVKYLIILNVAVFLLQIFITRPAKPDMADLDGPWNDPELRSAKAPAGDAKKHAPTQEQKDEEARKARELMERMMNHSPSMQVSVVTEWLELDPQKTIGQGQLWRLISCAFCHDRLSIFHILFNMVALYWFGTRLERMYGSTEFLLFYLTAAICSSLAYVGLAYHTGSMTPAIGASGAVMGVMLLYTIYYPFETFLCFWCIPVPLWVLLGLYVLYDLHPVLLALAGDQLFSRVAHAGHLGGLAFGFIYWKSGMRLERLLGRKWRALRLPTLRSKRLRVFSPPPSDDLADRVDAILKKISEHGKESLSDEERDILIQAGMKYRATT